MPNNRQIKAVRRQMTRFYLFFAICRGASPEGPAFIGGILGRKRRPAMAAKTKISTKFHWKKKAKKDRSAIRITFQSLRMDLPKVMQALRMMATTIAPNPLKSAWTNQRL